MRQQKNLFSKISSKGKALYPTLQRGVSFAKEFAKKHKIWSAFFLLLFLLVLFFLLRGIGGKKDDSNIHFNEVTVSRQTLSSTVTGSSILEPNAEYSITPLVTGEILEAPFEEGDVVTAGQMMYQIDAETMENSLSSSDISIQKAEKNYREAADDISNLSIRSTLSGRISQVYVKKGDLVNNGTKIADVTSDSVMKIRIPFNESDISSISVGMTARLTLVGNGSQVLGTVTSVSTAGEVLHGHMRVCYVTFSVNNPGGISQGDTATAMIGSIACNDVGAFEPMDTITILAKTSGTLTSVSVTNGDQVYVGTIVATIDSETVDSQLENAELSLQEAQLSRDKILKQLDDYTITAPIDGTVVLKNKKAGEKIESGSSTSSLTGTSSNVLAIIYDMSSLCFRLDVDELDVKKIKVGQEVLVTADAAEGKTYTGIVENVSISGTVGSNGVTTYPVKVRLQEFDDRLLPGMNIEATITVDKTENALVVPINAINRGNTVFVKGDKTEEKDMAPEGYKTVQVETGLSNDNFIEITAGLQEGDVVYVIAPSGNEERRMMMPGMGGMPSGGMGGMSGGSFGGGQMNNRGGSFGGGMPGGGR